MKKLFTIILLIVGFAASGQTMLTTKTKVTIKEEVQVVTNNFTGVSDWLKERITYYKMNGDTMTAKVISKLNRTMWDAHREFKRSLTKIDTIIVEIDSLGTENIIKEYPAKILKLKADMKKDEEGKPEIYQDKINGLQNELNEAKKAKRNWVHKPCSNLSQTKISN